MSLHPINKYYLGQPPTTQVIVEEGTSSVSSGMLGI